MALKGAKKVKMAEDTTIRKCYRVDLELNKKIKKLMKYYAVKNESELFRVIVNEIYELKTSKALVPFEEFKQEKTRLEQAIFEIGKLKGIIEEKEKQLQELKQIQSQQRKKRGFWSRLFGID